MAMSLFILAPEAEIYQVEYLIIQKFISQLIRRIYKGNKRTAKQQSCDQTLTRMNKALAINCNAKFNPRVGATAEYWRDGIPIRVVRSFKLAKFSQYAPIKGYRYNDHIFLFLYSLVYSF